VVPHFGWACSAEDHLSPLPELRMHKPNWFCRLNPGAKGEEQNGIVV
jgi:hypothetical protein